MNQPFSLSPWRIGDLSKLVNGRTLTALISIANSLTLATISDTVSGRFSGCLLRSSLMEAGKR